MEALAMPHSQALGWFQAVKAGQNWSLTHPSNPLFAAPCVTGSAAWAPILFKFLHLSKGTKQCLVYGAGYKQLKQSSSSWACKSQRFLSCIDEKWKQKNQDHPSPHQNKSEANSEAGKAKVHFKVNSGVAQCVNLMKHTGKSQNMSHSHQSIKTLWESTAITLQAK